MATRNRIAESSIDSSDVALLEAAAETNGHAAPKKRGRPARAPAAAAPEIVVRDPEPTSTKTIEKDGRKIVTMDFVNPALGSFGWLYATLVSTAPLMMHQFGEKMKNKLLGDHMGDADSAKKKAPKNPVQECLEALHIIGKRPKSMDEDDLLNARYGMPATALKAGIIRASKACGAVMTDVKTAIFVRNSPDSHYLFEIVPDDVPELDTRITRNANGMPDVRCRPLFKSWRAEIAIEYNARVVTPQRLLVWLGMAGKINGLGEWRPNGKSSSGDYGTFRVESARAETPVLES